MKPKESVNSTSLEQTIVHITSETSYREACCILNHFYHRNGEGCILPNTLSDHISSVGSRMQTEIDWLSSEILPQKGFSITESVLESPSTFKLEIPYEPEKPTELFGDTIGQYNQAKEERFQIKDTILINETETHPENNVYISIDDVGVKHQKDTRKNGGSKEGKNVENTVIHVETEWMTYIITAVGMDLALKQLLAWLLSTGFIYTKHLRFFSDGASNIRAGLERWFSFVSYKLKLDWYHLEKHLEETLSMALVKQFRMDYQKTLFSELWAGNVGNVISELESLLSSD